MALNDLCFVDMPFGKKTDLTSGVEIDFDQIYQRAIKPAIEAVGLEALRGDEEAAGGIIHGAMFARLLLAEYVVADLTTANPNVYYELGIRHAARPFTTVPIFATIHALPFDIALIRAVPYQLEQGKLTKAQAGKLQRAIEARLRAAIQGPPTKDSPLFELVPDYPVIDLPHEVTEAFQERVRHSDAFNAQLAKARGKPSDSERRDALLAIQHELGDLKVVQRNILVELLLSYRAVEAWPEMLALADAMPEPVQDLTVVRQQRAMALNRCGERERALKLLERLIKDHGPDPESLGILGRVHKDRYKEAKQAGSIIAPAALDDAIDAYRQGFEADPRDYYPGVNAVTLLVEKGDEEALAEADRLVPLVSFAVARRGGASSRDYWDLATVLELACIGGEWATAGRVLPRVIAAADEPWMAGTTHDNLALLKDARGRQGLALPQLDEIIVELEKRRAALAGS
jgi:tetratricopeptide (TPR) repeat protein